MEMVLIGLDISPLVLREHLDKIPHVHEAHIQLIWRTRYRSTLAFEFRSHDYSFLPQVEGEYLHSLSTSISDSFT